MQSKVMKTLLVTGGDKVFDDLLEDCVRSVRDVGYNGDIAVLDFGFSAEMLERIKNCDIIVKAASLPPEVEAQAIKVPVGAGVLLLKPYLPQLFPGYDRYIFIDADVYCQDDIALTALEHEAEGTDFVAVSQRTRFHEWDVARGNGIEFNVFGQPLRRNWYTMFANRSKLPKEDKKLLAQHQIINAGVFSAEAQSPIWSHWIKEMINCMKAMPVGRKSAADQLGLGLALYRHGLNFKTLPEICNWTSTWRYDPEKHLFTETEPFYRPVSIMHLAGMRADDTTRDVIFPDGKKKPLNLSYRALIERRTSGK